MKRSLRKYEFFFTILLLNTAWSIRADTKGVVAVIIGKVKLNNRKQKYMNISSVSSTPTPYQADSVAKPAKQAAPTTPAAPTAPTGPVDSDGDHDGSHLNVTA
jgi:hypothetical protein